MNQIIDEALVIAIEQATEAFDYAKDKDDHMLCEMRHRTIETALAALRALPGRLDCGALVNALKEIEALGAHGETAARLGNIAHAALIAFYTLPPTLNSGAVTIKPRRLFEEHRPDGMMESDRDFMDNNREACVAFLESAALRRAVEGGAVEQ